MTSLPPAFATKTRPSDCTVWIGATNNKGYGVLTIDGARHLAHRVAYEAQYGPVPDGMVLDHLCRVRNCVRPDHPEVVTVGENNRRGRRLTAARVGEECVRGHYIASEADLYVRSNGVRECRECRRKQKRDERAFGGVTDNAYRLARHVRADLDAVAASESTA
jgi:hypothetical protein